MTIGDHLDRLIVKAVALIGCPFELWFQPSDPNVRRAMRGEPVRPEWMHGPVAGDAAGTSSGAVSMFPVMPAPERPDLLLQAMAIEELYAFHGLVWDTPHSIRCHGCGHIAHSERRHWRHVTELVTDMVTTDYRIQQLLNK